MSSPKPRKILIAEDDGHIREVVSFALSQAGYEAVEAQDGRAAWTIFDEARSNKAQASSPAQATFAEAADASDFDLVVLDILMPGLDGLDVCRRIRQVSRIPIIFLSSKDEELDRILGLELGADDYITKPFSPRELVARIKAALRRYDDVFAYNLAQSKLNAPSENGAQSQHGAQTSLQPEVSQATDPRTANAQRPTQESERSYGKLRLDDSRHECWVGEEKVVLTVSEFSLIAALLRRPEHVLSRQKLVELAYGDAHFLSDRTVDSHVRRIRQKLKNADCEYIRTVYGVGYKLAKEE